MEKMEYVLVYAKRVNKNSESILLVLKDRPSWQKGKFNLVGGKIEDGETPIQAAVRELEEEAGLKPCSEPVCMGKIIGPWGIVHCIKIPVFDSILSPNPDETEIVAWVKYKDAINHELLIPNLRVIIPIMTVGVVGWTVYDEGPTWESDKHTIMLEVASFSGP